MAVVARLLKYLFTLQALQGYRTYLAAAGALGYAVYALSQGDYEKAVASVIAFVGMLGLKTPDAPPDVKVKGFAAGLVLAVGLLALPGVAHAADGKVVSAPDVEGGQIRLVKGSQVKSSPAMKRATMPQMMRAGIESPTPAAPQLAPLTKWDYSKGHTINFPLWGNDRYGDCYPVAACKHSLALSLNVPGAQPWPYTTSQIVARYLQLSPRDQGTDDQTIFKEMRGGLLGPNGPFKSLDLLVVDPKDIQMIGLTARFGPQMWTASLADSWLNNVKPGAKWDNARPNPENGHAMLVSGANGDGTYSIETWGLNPPVIATGAALVNGGQGEIVAIFSLRAFDAAGYTIHGDHYTALAPVWEQIGGAKLPASPFPAPKPPAPPAPVPPTPTPGPTPGPTPATITIDLKPGDKVPPGVTIRVEVASPPQPMPGPEVKGEVKAKGVAASATKPQPGPERYCVRVVADGPNGQSSGSGTVVNTPAGKGVLTARHVVEGATAVVVYDADGRPFSGSVYAVSPSCDLAVVSAPPDMPAAEVTDGVLVGAGVRLFGHPAASEKCVPKAGNVVGRVYLNGRPAVNTGLVSMPGDSGAGVFDPAGKVCGVLVSGSGKADGTAECAASVRAFLAGVGRRQPQPSTCPGGACPAPVFRPVYPQFPGSGCPDGRCPFQR